MCVVLYVNGADDECCMCMVLMMSACGADEQGRREGGGDLKFQMFCLPPPLALNTRKKKNKK